MSKAQGNDEVIKREVVRSWREVVTERHPDMTDAELDERAELVELVATHELRRLESEQLQP